MYETILKYLPALTALASVSMIYLTIENFMINRQAERDALAKQREKLIRLRRFFAATNAGYEFINSLQIASGAPVSGSKMQRLHREALVLLNKPRPDMAAVDLLIAEIEALAKDEIGADEERRIKEYEKRRDAERPDHIEFASNSYADMNRTKDIPGVIEYLSDPDRNPEFRKPEPFPGNNPGPIFPAYDNRRVSVYVDGRRVYSGDEYPKADELPLLTDKINYAAAWRSQYEQKPKGGEDKDSPVPGYTAGPKHPYAGKWPNLTAKTNYAEAWRIAFERQFPKGGESNDGPERIL